MNKILWIFGTEREKNSISRDRDKKAREIVLRNRIVCLEIKCRKEKRQSKTVY